MIGAFHRRLKVDLHAATAVGIGVAERAAGGESAGARARYLLKVDRRRRGEVGAVDLDLATQANIGVDGSAAHATWRWGGKDLLIVLHVDAKLQRRHGRFFAAEAAGDLIHH